jgi:aspartyl-tRNA(Asn)/glutamyl-tRNA(Gln) amidotransferase subunit B
MENGSLRCDINVSLREKGSTKLGTKTECKNLNTIQNIRAAVDYEVKRQSEILLSGGKVEQETRRYDEAQKKTVLMRKKTNAIDYKYFREPNIVPIDLEEGFIYDAIHSMNKLPNAYREDLAKLGFDDYEIEELLKDRDFVTYYEDCVSLGVKNPTTLWNALMVDILGYLNKNSLALKDLKFTKENLVTLVNLLADGKINSKQGKEVLAIMLSEGKDPKAIVKEKGLEQISDTSAIEALVEQVLSANAQSIADWQRGKDHALGYLVGQVMKASKGKANPALAKELILKKIGPCGAKKGA